MRWDESGKVYSAVRKLVYAISLGVLDSDRPSSEFDQLALDSLQLRRHSVIGIVRWVQ
jgi:hypothetical protein